jgi:uncharacterized protein (TIGR03435 family)
MRFRVFCLPFFLGAYCYGQELDRSLQFEVASVKLSEASRLEPGKRLGCNGGPGTDSPGQITCEHVSMRSLLMLAFDLMPYEYKVDTVRDFSATTVTGGYSISAKIPRGTTPPQVRTMWQNLLSERFHLTYHFEEKDSVVYNLVVAQGGPKLKGVIPQTGDAKQLQARADAHGCPILHPRPGGSEMARFGRVVCYVFSAVTVEDLARFVATQAGVPVKDMTSLKGKYDFSIRFAQGSDGAATIPEAPLLLDALPQQLGIRIEKRNGTARVFVVDHVEKVPSEN